MPGSVSASEFTATLDGESGVVLGEPMTLDWYVTGGPATCTINNEVGTFEVTTDPQGGSVEAIPPNSGEPFQINCSRGGPGDSEIASDTLVVIPNPVITFTSDDETELVNRLDGSQHSNIEWNTQYATECSAITYTVESDPGTVNDLNWRHYWGIEEDDHNRYLTQGGFHAFLSETTTYFITCYNTIHGTENTESITITITDPPPPEPPVINVIQPVGNPTDVDIIEARRYGEFTYEFEAENVTDCYDYKAYNVHEYPAVEKEIPVGYDFWSGLHYRNMDLRIATSTVLTVTCGRPDVTIGGVVYPATSTTLVKTFNLVGDIDIDLGDGSTVGSTTVIATPSSAEVHPTTGEATIQARVLAENVDYCNFYAYRESDGVQYSLPNWSKSRTWERVRTDANQDLQQTYLPSIGENTVLRSRCVNVYDFYFGTPEEQAQAVVEATTLVTVTAPADLTTSPKVWLYSGPSIHFTADDIWDLQSDSNNVTKDRVNYKDHIGVDLEWRWEDAWFVDESTEEGSISFIFDHPHGDGQSSIYNIHMRHCDESDGESVYAFSTDRSGQIGTHTSDTTYPGHNGSCDSSNEEVSMVVEGVLLTDGDEVTISCVASSNDPASRQAEFCQFSDVYFGTGSGDRVVTVPEDIDAPENQLIWMSEGATRCYSMEAETDSGTEYTWSNSSSNFGSVTDAPLEAITEYSIACDRSIDDAEVTETTEVVLSEDPNIPLEAEEVASDEVVYEVGACWDIAPEPDVLLSSAPENYVVAPEDLHLAPGTFVLRSNQCVPLVDLSVSPVYRGTNAAADSIVDIADGVDNVNGTYDLSIVPYVQNLSDVDLPENANITYRVTLNGNGVNETNSGVYNTRLPANTVPDTYELTNQQYDGVSFGTYQAEIRFNLGGAPNYPDSNFTNNRYPEVGLDTVVLPVPEPHISLYASESVAVIDNALAAVDTPLIRSGETFDVTWAVNVNYAMNCTLTGPGIGIQNLTLDTVGSNAFGVNPSSDSVEVSLTNTSEFQINCTEPTTGESFTETGTIEVVPNFQEL